MTTPTRRISFYLKPAAVKNEGEACAWLGQPYTRSPQKRPTRGFSGRAGTSEDESGRGLPTGRMG
ncbi:putative stability/partitioning protein [Escherichia coli]|nr:putative stability/partitioning protein [Escherichia coli]